MQSLTTNSVLAQSGENYTKQTQGKPVPQKWLCRLGPWQKTFEPGEEGEVCDWAQQKTGHWEGRWNDEPLGMRQYYLREVRECVSLEKSGDWEAFGRRMKIDRLPLAPKRVPPKLPRFYPVLDRQRWTDVEVFPMTEYEPGCAEECEDGEMPDYWSVFVRLEYGGRDCVADMPTEQQAQDLAAVIMSAANWFVPAK